MSVHGPIVLKTNGSWQSIAAGSSGQILRSGGASADPAYSTATYPATAGTASTLLRSDGTNFVNTTATYPSTAGTADNVLTSDGTNFVSTPSAQYLYFASNNTNPTDLSVYSPTAGGTISTGGGTVNSNRYYMLRAGTVKAVGINIFVAGTLGSNETSTFDVRKNGSTDNNVITGILHTAISQNYSNLNCGVTFVAGDYLEFLLVNPTWATNPTTVNYLMQIIIQ